MGLQDALDTQATRLNTTSLQELLRSDATRAESFSLRAGPLYANFARQDYDKAALDALLALADSRGVRAAYKRMVDGEVVNVTEQRPALHTALRGDLSPAKTAHDAFEVAKATRERMHAMVRKLRADGIRDVLSLGIGGSDLGPRFIVDALGQDADAPRVHFVSNVDGHALERAIAGLDPATTALIIISKSFNTQETLANAEVARAWLGDGGARTYAVTSKPSSAEAIGVAAERVLPMWDWVGGRYSLWSAVGFPIAIAVGCERFDALLRGAGDYDRHCLEAPARDNPSIWHALTAVWNRDARGRGSLAVVPYDDRLKLLPAYLQQLVMESLGKSVTIDGAAVGAQTSPVWWGSAGTDAQHSYFQMLHQGTAIVPMDLIGVVNADHAHAANHELLLANLLAQAQALAMGESADDPHRNYQGGRPSTLLLLDALTPEALGTLVAFYEHSVHAQSVLWNINAFDQFGVELGKRLADRTLPALKGAGATGDAVTDTLIAELGRRAR
ncbi:glucose-6-phosphate isomerase [Solilutibacter silvestris]|uniref:Glucose-6-phosphate isomerase n=1 Tax=Solilutibacter silvestris TaxID=1645665 RepID=A0A2K1PYY4_9GAMM|nr:glucose-6-phosphate isomerase [Lysobacter silvestris]PNS07980.1 Glucose-6-phosphate isomerase [Lysobacter silvestris]